MGAYEELERRFARYSQLRDVAGMLHWDTAAMMPPGGAEARAGQLATLDVMAHEILIDPALAALIAEASDGDGLDPWQGANLGEMRRIWGHANAVDSELVAALSKASSNCEMAWRTARQENDFASIIAPAEELLARLRESARARGEKLGLGDYDALLDQYEPGALTAQIDPVLDDLAAFLPDFLERVLAHQADRPAPLVLEGPFDTGAQQKLCVALMKTLGFDFSRGRLDVSHHPFCGGVPEDVRITTRYDEADFMPAMMAALHETGHALYEQGLPDAWRHQPVGAARGMGLHESQSLLIEMQACRGREFLSFVAPMIRDAFGADGRAWETDNLYRLGILVKPGMIRVDADEVTYPLHVILRYRLEKAMIAGDLAIRDLPGAWNDAMGDLLGLTPANDAEGCLQDIHWYDGAHGYFPTYTLGALAAAQLFGAAAEALTGLGADLARGDFSDLIGWLRANIHAKGSSLTSDETITAATGRPLDSRAFKRHLENRYLG
jgi:carboxypeptidase Taq